jgi:hypothetical protein
MSMPKPASIPPAEWPPAGERDHAHFRLDVEYLRDFSEDLATNWALRYFGDWHSHHAWGLRGPAAAIKSGS